MFLSAIALLALIPLLRFVPHLCLMKTLLHVPCPGCGITTGLRSLIALNIPAAWRANPASLIIFVGLAVQLCLRPLALLSPNSLLRGSPFALSNISPRFISRPTFRVDNQTLLGEAHGRYYLSQMRCSSSAWWFSGVANYCFYLLLSDRSFGAVSRTRTDGVPELSQTLGRLRHYKRLLHYRTYTGGLALGPHISKSRWRAPAHPCRREFLDNEL